MVTKTDWERAARAEGWGDRLVPEPVCPECSGEGLIASGDGPSERYYTCEDCGGHGERERIVCPATHESWERGEMAWMRDGLDTVVSVASKLGCEKCGERPRLPGEDVCGDCLPRTRRSGELAAVGVAS